MALRGEEPTEARLGGSGGDSQFQDYGESKRLVTMDQRCSVY